MGHPLRPQGRASRGHTTRDLSVDMGRSRSGLECDPANGRVLPRREPDGFRNRGDRMFHKADGTDVWLRTAGRLPYLCLAGVIESPEDYAAIRPRLRRAHEPLSGIASDDAFLVQEFEGGGALVFCARPDKRCALLLLGKFDRGRESRKPCAVLESLVAVIENSVDGLARQAGAVIRFDVVQSELAMRAE